MPTRTAEAEWQGSLSKGSGIIRFGGGDSFGSRFGAEKATNPEELIAAAHAGCFSMALAYGLDAKRIRTTGKAHIEAREQNLNFRVQQADIIGWYSARWVREDAAGFKVLVEKGTGRVLGAHIIGPSRGRDDQPVRPRDRARPCRVGFAALRGGVSILGEATA